MPRIGRVRTQTAVPASPDRFAVCKAVESTGRHPPCACCRSPSRLCCSFFVLLTRWQVRRCNGKHYIWCPAKCRLRQNGERMKKSLLSVLVFGVFGITLGAQDATRGGALYK